MIKILSDVLNEKFINWFPQEDPDGVLTTEYADALSNMIDISYAPIGGFKHGHYDIKEFIDDCSLIKIYKSNGVPAAFRASKDKYGRKAICSGTNGTMAGKHGLYLIFKEDIKFCRAWAEVNDKLEYIFCKKFGAERIPNEMVEELIEKEVVRDPDGYHYERMIGGQMHRKVIITGSSDQLVAKLQKVKDDD